MAKNSTLNPNRLLDQFIPLIDELKTELYNEFAVRQYDVRIVKRLWSGGEVGLGTVSTVSTTTLEPKPTVVDGSAYMLSPDRACGLVDAGQMVLQEVSLHYDNPELLGTPRLAGEEFYYELVDAQGQHIPTTYWVPAADPVPDRQKKLAWEIVLKRYEPSTAI